MFGRITDGAASDALVQLVADRHVLHTPRFAHIADAGSLLGRMRLEPLAALLMLLFVVVQMLM